MTTYLTLPLVGAGVAATKMALSFNQTFTKIQSLAGKTGMSLDQMKATVTSLAGQTAQDPTQLANALYFVASSGLKTSQVMGVLKASAQGAAVGMGDAETNAQTLTSVMNAYAGTGLKVSQVMNILTEGVKVGKMEMSDLTTTLGGVVAGAAQAGVSFQSLVAAIATATDAGVTTARAVTGLRYLISSLVKPTTAAGDAIANMGMTQQQLANDLKNKGLGPTLQLIADKLDLTSLKGRQAFATIVGGSRGAIVANTLVGNSAGLAAKNEDLLAEAAKGSSTAFNDALKKMTGTDMFKFQQAWVRLKIAAIDLGDVLIPILVRDVLPAIKSAAQWFGNLSDAGKETFAKIGIAVAAGGPLLMLVGVLLRIVGAATSAVAWIGKLGTASSAIPAVSGAVGGGGGAASATAFGATYTGFAATALSFAAVSSAAILAGIAIKDVLTEMGRSGREADVLVQALDNGTASFNKLGMVAQADAKRYTSTWDAIAHPLGDIAGMETLSAEQKALGAYTNQLFKLIATYKIAGNGANAFFRGMAAGGGVTLEQADVVAKLLGVLSHKWGASLSKAEAANLQLFLSVGDVKNAMALLTRAIDHARTSSNKYGFEVKRNGTSFDDWTKSITGTTGATDDLSQSLMGIPNKVTSTVDVNTDAATAKIRAFIALMAQIPGSTYTTGGGGGRGSAPPPGFSATRHHGGMAVHGSTVHRSSPQPMPVGSQAADSATWSLVAAASSRRGDVHIENHFHGTPERMVRDVKMALIQMLKDGG